MKINAKMIRWTIYTILTFLVASASAQSIITGVVTDSDGTPLPGANVYLQGTYDGGSTDEKGVFNFQTNETDEQILIVSMLGFLDYQREVICSGSQIVIDIKMEEAFNKLQAVEITAGAMEASDEKRSVVFKPLDIVTTAGALGDVVGALNTLPGTSVNTNDGRLLVRGGNADETAIFFDGLKVNNAYGSTVSGIPTRTRFSPQLFKGTFFSTGGYSAEYGQALSSVLALNTLDMPIRDQSDLSLMSVGGAFSHTEVLDKDAFTLNGSYTNLAPYMGIVPQNLGWKKAPESYNLEGLYRHPLGKRSLVKLYYTHQASQMKVFQTQPGTEAKQLQGVKNRFNYANASLRHSFNHQWLLKGGVSYSHNFDRFSLDSLQANRKETLLHLKARLSWFATERLQFHTGIEQYQQSFSESMEKMARNIVLPLTAGHLESQYFFTEKLTLKAGLRLEAQQDHVKLMPRLSGAYQLSKHQQVSAAYGSFLQNQEIPSLLVNPTLDQSQSTHYLLNYQWSQNNRTLRAEIFQKDYDYLIRYTASEPLNTSGEGFARGFDLFYRDQESVRNLDFWITYSFIDSKRVYKSYFEPVQPSFAPKHNFSIVGKYWIEQLNSQLGMSWQANDGYSYDNPNLPGQMESKTKAFAGLNLNWSYLPKPNLILHFAVNNVLGRQNVFGYSYADQPNASGQYASLPVMAPADRFFFVGVFITLSEDKKANQLNNL